MSLPTKSVQTIALLTYGKSDARKAHRCNQLTRPMVVLTNPKGFFAGTAKDSFDFNVFDQGMKALPNLMILALKTFFNST